MVIANIFQKSPVNTVNLNNLTCSWHVSHVDNANKVVSERPGTQDHHLASHSHFWSVKSPSCTHLFRPSHMRSYRSYPLVWHRLCKWVLGHFIPGPGDHKCLLFHGLLDVWTIYFVAGLSSHFEAPNQHRQRQQPNTNQLASGCWCSSMISISGIQRWTARLKAGAWLTTVEDLFRRLKTTAAASTSESDLRFSDVYPMILRSCPCTLSIFILKYSEITSATRSISVFRIPEVAPVRSPSRILCSQIGACTSGMKQLHHLHLITSSISVVEGGATIQRPCLHLGVQVTVW